MMACVRANAPAHQITAQSQVEKQYNNGVWGALLRPITPTAGLLSPVPRMTSPHYPYYV
jgi:hypothetical protein